MQVIWWQRWNGWSYIEGMQHTGTKGKQDKARLGRKGDPLGIVQEIKIWPYNQMLCAQTGNPLKKILYDFEIESDQLVWINKNKILDFTIPADYRVKRKEKENIDIYLDFARELKWLRNTRVTVLIIVWWCAWNGP